MIFSATEPQPAISPDIAPRIVLVDGSNGYRRLIAAFLQARWPQAVIEQVDPFSQTMRGPGIAFGTTGDLIVLGGIGTVSEAIAVLKRLQERVQCPPVILLVSHSLAAETASFIAAGAAGVLFKDALSQNALCQLVTKCLQPQSDSLAPHANAGADGANYGTFTFVQGSEQISLDIEGYRCLATLASNPMAQVFYVEDTANRERAVIKVPTSSPHNNLNSIERFCLRFKFVSSLQGQDVVRYLDVGIAGPWPYEVLEYLAGGDLRSWIKPDTLVGWHVETLCKLAKALTTLHAGQLAHLDLKPENIFFRKSTASGDTPGDELVLIDFNISTPFGGIAKSPLNAQVLGTPAYMSPEQGQGLAVDGRSDLYSAGVIFYEMLTGEKPYTAKNDTELLFRHIHDEIPLLPMRIRRFQPIIDSLMAKHPDERFASGAELAAALQPFLTDAGAAAAP